MAAGDLITLVTADFGVQYEWAAELFGTGTDRIVTEMDGLDSMPELVVNDVDRNDDHGSVLGFDTMKSRELTMTVDMSESSHADVLAAVRTMARVMRPSRAESPFVFQRPGEVKKQVFARARKRDLPSTSDVAMGLAHMTLNWMCGDPRIYSLAVHHAQLIVPALTQAGQIVISNDGDFHTYPWFTLSGAGSDPRISVDGQTSDDIDGTDWNGQTTALDLNMAGLDILEVFPKTRHILLNGDSAYSVRRSDNQWWELMPGDNTIHLSRTNFNSAQTLDIYWYDTWI